MIFSRQLLMNKAETAEGYPLMFSSKRDKQARDWSITGANIGDIGTDGKYHVNVVNSGKSLISATDYFSKAANYSSVTEDGRNCAKFQNGVTYKYTDFTFKPNTQYTVSFDVKSVLREGQSTDTSGSSYVWQFKYTDGTVSTIHVINGAKWAHRTLTSTAGKTIEYVWAPAYEYRYWLYVDIDTFQLEEGAVETEVEPYREPTVTEVTLDEPIGVIKSEKNLATPYRIYTKAEVYDVVTIDGRNCVQFEDWNTAKIELPFKENTQYTVQLDFKNEIVHTEAQGGAVNSPSAVFAFFYTDGTYTPGIAAYTTADWTHRTLTSTAGKTIRAVGVPSTSWCRRTYIDVDTFQLEEGITPTEVEPYYIPTVGTATYKYGVLPPLSACEGTNIISIEGYEPSDNLFNVDEFVRLILAKDSTATVETIDDRRCIKFYNKNVYGIDLSTVCTFEPSTTYTLSADIKYISGTNETSSNALYFGFIYEGADTTNFPSYPSNIGVAYRTIVGTRTNAADWLAGSITSKTTNINALGLSYGNNAYWAIDLDTIQLVKGTIVPEYKPYCKVKNITIKY